MPTYDVDNTNGTNKRRYWYSLTSHGLFPEEQKGCCKGSRGTGELLYIDQHILNESKRQENLAMFWIDNKKGIWYGSAKLDNKLPQKVQNIRWSHKLYLENDENLERGIDNRREKLSWSEDPKRYIPRRCTIIITIYNCDNATRPHIQRMHSRIQT